MAAVEWCPDASTTYRFHHPEARVVQGDISTLDFRPERGRFVVVAGGPPCQPFSVGGKRLAAGDPRNGIPQFLRALAELQPRAFIMENVAGLTASTKWPYFQSILAQLEQLGYQISWRVMEAADCGVPQTRRRLFVVGAREDRFVFPRRRTVRAPVTRTSWPAPSSTPTARGAAKQCHRYLCQATVAPAGRLPRPSLQRRRPAHRAISFGPDAAGEYGRQQDTLAGHSWHRP